MGTLAPEDRAVRVGDDHDVHGLVRDAHQRAAQQGQDGAERVRGADTVEVGGPVDDGRVVPVRVDVRGEAALPRVGDERARDGSRGRAGEHGVVELVQPRARSTGSLGRIGTVPPASGSRRRCRHLRGRPLRGPRICHAHSRHRRRTDRLPIITPFVASGNEAGLGATSGQRDRGYLSRPRPRGPTPTPPGGSRDPARPAARASPPGRPARRTPAPPALLIVDGEAIVRFGLRQLFAADPELVVVGEAAGPRDALASADRCPPDLVVLDVDLGREGAGLDLARRLLERHRGVRMLVLTSSRDRDLMMRAMRLGVHGFLRKTADTAEVIAAVRSLLRGEGVFDAGPGGRGATWDLPAPTSRAARCSPSGRTRCSSCSRWA